MRRVVLRILGGLLLLGVLLLVATPLGRYLLRAGWEEAKILAAREDIAALVADPATPDVLRARLQLVLEARAFAVDSLGLPAERSFTQFTQLSRDTLVLVLSGARRDELVPKLWWFPVVGRLPYKGYFRESDAMAAVSALEAEGFDSYLRPASAFSTLGWFNDPLLSTTVRQDSVDLVDTVIHELLHNRYFASGDAGFNESFANFVGARGAERFFASRGDTLRSRWAAARWDDERRLARFWADLYRTVDSLFSANPGDTLRARRVALRDSVYVAARTVLREQVVPSLRTTPPGFAEFVRLDNASLLARRIYLTDLEQFEIEYEQQGRELRRTIDAVIAKRAAAGRRDGDPARYSP